MEKNDSLSKVVKEIITYQIIGRIQARSAIECSTFLYLNEKPHSIKEIWSGIERNFHLDDSAPRTSFNSDSKFYIISRYCDNSNMLHKKNPLLFTIVNLEKKEYKIILKSDIRKKIDNYLQIISRRKPNVLVIYKENMVMSKNEIEYFIPEISVYLSNGDPSLRREFFKSEAYTWRRKLQLLNLVNDFKKGLFLDKIKEISRDPDVQLYDVNLILDLNGNDLFIKLGSEILEEKIKLPFNSYNVHSLNEQEFRNVLTCFKDNNIFAN